MDARAFSDQLTSFTEALARHCEKTAAELRARGDEANGFRAEGIELIAASLRESVANTKTRRQLKAVP